VTALINANAGGKVVKKLEGTPEGGGVGGVLGAEYRAGDGKKSRKRRTKKSRTKGGKKSRKQRKRTTLKGGKRKRRRTRRRR
tara:strand:+ start:503 stop:748 length:246 start_codon:yes stop_codon:yes gene_type:complete